MIQVANTGSAVRNTMIDEERDFHLGNYTNAAFFHNWLLHDAPGRKN
jgi:hypothetical protein